MAKIDRGSRKSKFTRERQFAPGLCKIGTFRIKTINKNVKLIICKKKGRIKTSVQSILRRK